MFTRFIRRKVAVWSRWQRIDAASDNITHGSWLLAAGMVGMLALGVVAVPESPVHHWFTCSIANITTIQSTAASNAVCPVITPVQSVSGPVTFPSMTTANPGALNPGWAIGPGPSLYSVNAGRPIPYILLSSSGQLASFSFTIPNGESSTLTYGIPADGYVNNGNSMAIQINGVTWNTISRDGPVDDQTSVDVAYWSHYFVSGQYTITFDDTSNPALGSPNFNIYGVWASDPTAVVPLL